MIIRRKNLNLCGAYNNSDPSCIHLFRWYFSPIYLFAEPRLLSDLALNYLPGTATKIQQVHLVIPQICDNTTMFMDKENFIWDQGVLLLNKLTPFVSLYIIYLQMSQAFTIGALQAFPSGPPPPGNF